ncbi:MAG: TusE/DsrC/DsvC family sulfur relay protein [Pseudohongiella sp.]|nr:TusE/DsrC/DsvC family sulfur relay protein [Pseudohongiella sp.]
MSESAANRMLLLPDHRQIAVDQDGFLRVLADWDLDVAHALARAENIELSDAHWEIITLVQRFYQQTGLSPATRALVRLVALQAGPDKGKSIYLMKLFGGKPALSISRIAGLPRPANCF